MSYFDTTPLGRIINRFTYLGTMSNKWTSRFLAVQKTLTREACRFICRFEMRTRKTVQTDDGRTI